MHYATRSINSDNLIDHNCLLSVCWNCPTYSHFTPYVSVFILHSLLTHRQTGRNAKLSPYPPPLCSTEVEQRGGVCVPQVCFFGLILSPSSPFFNKLPLAPPSRAPASLPSTTNTPSGF